MCLDLRKFEMICEGWAQKALEMTASCAEKITKDTKMIERRCTISWPNVMETGGCGRQEGTDTEALEVLGYDSAVNFQTYAILESIE